MFYYIYKPGQEITLSQKNFYEYIYERRSTSTSFCKWPNKSSPNFFAKKNVILTAFKIQSPPRKSFYFTVVKK